MRVVGGDFVTHPIVGRVIRAQLLEPFVDECDRLLHGVARIGVRSAHRDFRVSTGNSFAAVRTVTGRRPCSISERSAGERPLARAQSVRVSWRASRASRINSPVAA